LKKPAFRVLFVCQDADRARFVRETIRSATNDTFYRFADLAAAISTGVLTKPCSCIRT
jgi:hypothetical protein